MTLFISDKSKALLERTAFVYLCVSLFCVLFGAVYEWFSFGVYSYFMLYAFLLPLCGGTFVFFLFALGTGKRMPGVLPRLLWHFGIASLTVGSLLEGVLAIYGTANPLAALYPIGGGILLCAGLACYLYGLRKR